MTEGDLFEVVRPAHEPLASRMRPQSLEQLVGQNHLLGPGKPLRHAIESGKLHSFLLWGPPGVGKTTLAKALAKSLDVAFNRVQFTPDLLPSDILGASIYNPVDGSFSFRKIQSSRCAVLMEVLWKTFASRNVVLKARSAWRVK